MDWNGWEWIDMETDGNGWERMGLDRNGLCNCTVTDGIGWERIRSDSIGPDQKRTDHKGSYYTAKFEI